jgi:hypothetical protein
LKLDLHDFYLKKENLDKSEEEVFIDYKNKLKIINDKLNRKSLLLDKGLIDKIQNLSSI